MQVNGSIRVTRDMTVGELRRQLSEENIPDHAKLDLYIAPHDRQPGDGVRELKFSWDTSFRPPPQPHIDSRAHAAGQDDR